MKKNLYVAPVIWESESGGNPTVIGEGSGQGSIAPDGMTFEEWWTDIAWEGENPDADYNGDGVVNQADWQYYIDNELWNGDIEP